MTGFKSSPLYPSESSADEVCYSSTKISQTDPQIPVLSQSHDKPVSCELLAPQPFALFPHPFLVARFASHPATAS